MITDEIFTDELLQQAAAELAAAIIDSLPPPDECQHEFSDMFEEKMQVLLHPRSICVVNSEYISK